MPKYTVTFEKALTFQAERTIRAKTTQEAHEKAQAIEIPDTEWDITDEDVYITDIDIEEK